jgi:hypothetical protein
MESLILAAGLILFSGTVSYDMYNKADVAKNGNNTNATVQVEKGFFDQDKRK